MEHFIKLSNERHKANTSLISFFKKLLVVLAYFTIAFAQPARSQCIAPTLTFNSPQLIEGTDGTIGAVYLFPSVLPGVDAHITIMDLVGGASLAEIDNTTGAGYYDAFQPYMWAGENDTSYIDWKITFKIAGTSTDTTLACLAVTAIDVDGDNSALQEFVEAATPGSFAVDPFTNLVVSFDGVRSKAVGQITTIPLIDTAARQAMFQMNFTNINSLLYRNGAITTAGAQIRQTCIYFAPFFTTWTLLPVKILSFTAKTTDDANVIEWTASDEQENASYTVQKSVDQQNWKNLSTIANSKSGLISKYNYVDAEKNSGTVYYRLKQTAINNAVTYSKIIRTGNSTTVNTAISGNTIFQSKIALNVEAITTEVYIAQLINVSGQPVYKQQLTVNAGMNRINIMPPSAVSNGLYVLVVTNKQGKSVYLSKVFKQ